MRAVVVSACLIAMGGIIWLDHTGWYKSELQQAQNPEKLSQRDFEAYHGKVFEVIKVVDGDTLDIDAPDQGKSYTRIRLWGVDSPETHHPKVGAMYYGTESTEFATDKALNRKVTVYLDENNDTRGYYGRLLAYVKLPGGDFLNELLLTEGYAFADLRFEHSLFNKYKGLQALAKRQKKGLWEEVTRQELPVWLQRKRPELLKE